MKLLLVTIVSTILAATQAFATDYRLTEAKADRFFDNREWASAQALYGLMLDQTSGGAATYSRAIVASAISTIVSLRRISASRNSRARLTRSIANLRVSSSDTGSL